MLRNSAALFVCLFAPLQVARSDEPATEPSVKSELNSQRQPRYRNELIRGQVVWLAEALNSEFGISTVPEAAQRSLAILTNEGQLLPIVENIRGGAFRKDKRLLRKEMEILTRRYEDQPLVQILRVYEVDGSDRFEVDYWCDVCAIVMFEAGPCSCCQDDNRLRKRLVDSPRDLAREP